MIDRHRVSFIRAKDFGDSRVLIGSQEITDRAEFAVAKLPNGNTRMYVGDGNTGSPAARFYRSDSVATGTPVFTDLTTSDRKSVV